MTLFCSQVRTGSFKFILTSTRSNSYSFSPSRPPRFYSYPSTAKTMSTMKKSPPPAAAVPRPSSSVVLLSPTNQVLLLKRVQTSSSFASAHVFPGGNLDAKHDGEVGDPGDLERYHRDCAAYRMAAVRETFEETGMLLAFKGDVGNNKEVLRVDEEVRERGRRDVHSGAEGFGQFVERLGGRADVDGLIPFTRWITPPNMKKRFTTQMYVYMMPFEAEAAGTVEGGTVVVPTHDGGLEHTELAFNDVGVWLEQAKKGEVTLYPPQFYILSVLEPFFAGGKGTVNEQRERFLEFVDRVPTAEGGKETEMIPWKDKAMSPTVVGRKEDGRLIMGLDKPGPELEGTGRGGDGQRRIVVRFGKEGPSEVSIEIKGEKKANL
ncbi:nucleoside diphosphate-linked moiety X motif 19, mitochondrial [Cladorrhinum sp. PSN332]|nr:nucleoside diphosphate-linked moiety X motif 19, mitochondrial [Cladorrhinum sp. PSN332]